MEFNPVIAARASACLRPYPNVELVQGNGADWPRESADIVYVNFAVDRPADRWVEMLRSGGRLLFPLGVPAVETRTGGPVYSARAGYLMVTRTNTGFAARFLQVVSFVWSEAMPSTGPDRHARLRAMLGRGGGASKVKSLRWKTPPRPSDVYGEADWGLSADPPGEPD